MSVEIAVLLVTIGADLLIIALLLANRVRPSLRISSVGMLLGSICYLPQRVTVASEEPDQVQGLNARERHRVDTATRTYLIRHWIAGNPMVSRAGLSYSP